MRGKNAAQSANRRLREALAEISSLRNDLEKERAENRDAVNALEVNLQKLKNAQVREVAERSRKAIEQAEAVARESIAEVMNAHEEHVLAGLQLLNDHLPDGIRMRSTESFIDLAKAFNIPIGKLVTYGRGDDARVNRHQRRVSTRQATNTAAFHRDVARSGRPLVGGDELRVLNEILRKKGL